MFALCVLGCWGCDSPEPITSYEAPKPRDVYEKNHVDSERPSPHAPGSPQGPSRPIAAEPSRMLGAMVDVQGDTWFFKLTGPPESMSKLSDPFLQFVQSVRFAGDGHDRPEWTLPEGWRQRPGGSEFRYATIEVPSGDTALELSVTKLPIPPGVADAGSSEWALANVNRWRGQLGLAGLTTEELETETLSLEIDGRQARLVNIEGRGSGQMGGRPMAPASRPPAGPNMGPPAAGPPLAENPPAGNPADSNKRLDYEVPPGWKPSAGSGLSRAAFAVENETGQKIEITVTPLAAAAGQLLPNVNRWRAQIGLEPWSADQLAEAVQTIPSGDVEGQYVALTGPEDADPRQTILGVVTLDGPQAWFIKLIGDASLASEQQANFEAFVRSLRFP
jgi:hypothetical protein